MLNYESKYSLPQDITMQVHYILKGYDRLKNEYLEIMYSSPPPSDGIRTNKISTPTENKAIKLSYITDKLNIIDQTISETRRIYSDKMELEFDVMRAYWSYDYYNYIHKRKGLNDEGPCLRKWKYFKSYFRYRLAQRLNLY